MFKSKKLLFTRPNKKNSEITFQRTDSKELK